MLIKMHAFAVLRGWTWAVAEGQSFGVASSAALVAPMPRTGNAVVCKRRVFRSS
jgi:hypothetical protein